MSQLKKAFDDLGYDPFGLKSVVYVTDMMALAGCSGGSCDGGCSGGCLTCAPKCSNGPDPKPVEPVQPAPIDQYA